MNIPVLILMGLGILFIYAGIKNQSAIGIVKSVLTTGKVAK